MRVNPRVFIYSRYRGSLGYVYAGFNEFSAKARSISEKYRSLHSNHKSGFNIHRIVIDEETFLGSNLKRFEEFLKDVLFGFQQAVIGGNKQTAEHVGSRETVEILMQRPGGIGKNVERIAVLL